MDANYYFHIILKAIMVQQAQLDYKETFTWGTWWKQFWCQEVVTTSCQHSMNTDSMVATIGK